MKRLKLIIRELQNYFYIRRIAKREELTPGSPWNNFKLRRNWYGRIYTVISLRDEDMGEEEVVRNWKAMEKMRPVNEYLKSLDFQEIVFPSIEYIPNSKSYLVVYSPVLDYFTYGWVFSTLFKIAALSLLIWGAIKFFL